MLSLFIHADGRHGIQSRCASAAVKKRTDLPPCSVASSSSSKSPQRCLGSYPPPPTAAAAVARIPDEYGSCEQRDLRVRDITAEMGRTPKARSTTATHAKETNHSTAATTSNARPRQAEPGRRPYCR
ncbi:hypothetical protein HPB47_012792 [Ixodes persulcatus]|uniref:Uncharacterized protein n=1 Tax=Ixodes persulcatus TaxID=34615 RepID=A0AC60NSJ4_IXOPE|nr:hypothetical protein HPB47_012792 [Ixodes persulcatus]